MRYTGNPLLRDPGGEAKGYVIGFRIGGNHAREQTQKVKVKIRVE